MSIYTNGECSECGFTGLCIVDGDECYCDACVRGEEYPEDYDSQFDDDFDAMADEFDETFGDLNEIWDDYEPSDEPPMYGYDSDNPISMGAYDE